MQATALVALPSDALSQGPAPGRQSICLGYQVPILKISEEARCLFSFYHDSGHNMVSAAFVRG